ncbi:MAG: hypothetical protein J5I98_27500 [Phaeodactylibacter sp.]|nr:hypothetical protein [Phaeodactylibacter sp.]
MTTTGKAVFIPILFFPLCLKAQAAADVIHLKNGSTFEGTIVEYQQGTALLLRLNAGAEIEFREEEISRIEQGLVPATAEPQEPPPAPTEPGALKKQGFYNATCFSALSGSAEGKFQLGLGLHNVTGYQFHRLFGLGLGFGVDTYSFEDGETLYPVFGEARGYFSGSAVSPYYSGSLGYGLAFRNGDELINKASGGSFFRAALGLRLNASGGAGVLADIGYQFQEAFFERRTAFQNEIEEKRLVFNRVVIRVGLIL